jgi:hypothetical protein
LPQQKERMIHMLKIVIPEKAAYPKQIHGAIYNAIKNDYHSRKPMFSVYINGRTEMAFLNDEDGLAVWDAIQAKSFILRDTVVKNAIVESITSIDEIEKRLTDRITLLFLSPTTFKKRDIHLPLPEPANVFKNAAELLNIEVPEIILTDLNIKSEKIAISPDISISGFTGTCAFMCKDPNFLYPASKILEYTGAGWKTALGMGKVAIAHAGTNIRRTC